MRFQDMTVQRESGLGGYIFFYGSESSMCFTVRSSDHKTTLLLSSIFIVVVVDVDWSVLVLSQPRHRWRWLSTCRAGIRTAERKEAARAILFFPCFNH